MPREMSNRKVWPVSARALSCAVAWMAVEWIMLVDGTRPHEMLVGLVAVALSAVFVARAFQLSFELPDLRWRDVLTVWRLPAMVTVDAWTVIMILLKDLFGIAPADSVYRATGFHTAKDDPVLIARRVLATMYTTCTPNSIVIGIDPEQSKMVAHQLVLTPPSTLEKELGRQG